MDTSKTSNNGKQVDLDKTKENINWMQAVIINIPFITVTGIALNRFIETFGDYPYVAEENTTGIYLLWAAFNIVAIIFLNISNVKSIITYIVATILGLAPIILDEILAESQMTVFDYIGTQRGGIERTRRGCERGSSGANDSEPGTTEHRDFNRKGKS